MIIILMKVELDSNNFNFFFSLLLWSLWVTIDSLESYNIPQHFAVGTYDISSITHSGYVDSLPRAILTTLKSVRIAYAGRLFRKARRTRIDWLVPLTVNESLSFTTQNIAFFSLTRDPHFFGAIINVVRRGGWYRRQEEKDGCYEGTHIVLCWRKVFYHVWKEMCFNDDQGNDSKIIWYFENWWCAF